MSDYKLYTIGADGHIDNAVDLDCPNDAAALDQAQGAQNPHGLELWQGARRVATIQPPTPLPQERASLDRRLHNGEPGDRRRVLPDARIGKLNLSGI